VKWYGKSSRQRKRNNMAKLIGKNVYITWKDGSEWHWFKVIDRVPGMLMIQGIDSPDGVPHDGDVFWVPVSDIKTMEEV